MKVEIPLSFGRIRGHGVRWPLSFIYTSNIPVILVAALLANIQLWGKLVENWAVSSGSKILNFISVYLIGQTDTVNAGHGLVYWATPPAKKRAPRPTREGFAIDRTGDDRGDQVLGTSGGAQVGGGSALRNPDPEDVVVPRALGVEQQ